MILTLTKASVQLEGEMQQEGPKRNSFSYIHCCLIDQTHFRTHHFLFGSHVLSSYLVTSDRCEKIL